MGMDADFNSTSPGSTLGKESSDYLKQTPASAAAPSNGTVDVAKAAHAAAAAPSNPSSDSEEDELAELERMLNS